MNSRLRCLALVTLTASCLVAQDEAPKSSMKEVLKARIAEDAKKAEAKKATTPPAKSTAAGTSSGVSPSAAAPTADAAKQEPAKSEASKADPAAQTSAPTAAATNAKAAKESPTVLPKVEVRKGRITELDQKLAKQEQDLARERKNLKPTETDLALNDAKVARPLAIFGGESAQFRQRVASERVELMEAEKDLLEAIARAKTKQEKQELQKQLDEIKAMRRELEKSLR